MPVLDSLRVVPVGGIRGFMLADAPGQPAY